MTTNNTDRARKATQTIEQLGGLQRAEWGSTGTISANDLLTVLDLCSRLKLDVPKAFADELANTATIYQRAHKLKTAATTFTPDDLAASDFEERFTTAMTGQLRVLAKADALIDRAKASATSQAVAAVRQYGQSLIELLNAAYRDNLKGELGDAIRLAHRTLLNWQGGVTAGRIGDDYAASWCLTWAWTQEAWNKLADDTAAQMELPRSWTGSRFDFALACGGKPYLAPSTADASARSYHHREQYRDWQDIKRNERAQEYAQAEMARQMEEAKQQQEHDRAEARAYAAAAAAALAE